MSKVVKAVRKLENSITKFNSKTGIGRAINKVVAPVLKVKNEIRDGVQKFARTKVGKIVIAAVALYFGVPMIAGAIGGATAGAAAGTGFWGTVAGGASGAWTGAGAGLAQAWGGVAAAGSAAWAGNFSGAGSALAGGFSPSAAYAAGSGGVMSAAAPAIGATGATTATNAATAEALALHGAAPAAASAGMPAAAGGVAPTAAAAPAAAAKAAPAAASATGVLNPYTTPALIQAGSSMVSSMGQAKMVEAQREEEEKERLRRIAERNANMGILFASNSDPGPGYYRRSSFATGS